MEYKYRISVVICTYNREQFLPGLMQSILLQSINKQDFEILFINNNSTDDTESICQQFIKDYPDYSIRYLCENNQGLSYARNRGIRESTGKYLTFADDDALLAPDFLEKVCSFLDQHLDIAEVGGPIYLKYLGAIPKWENPYMNSLFGYFYPSPTPYYMKKEGKKYPRGSNMTFRTDVFSTCGDFNTSLGRIKRVMLGGEEKDIAFRILNSGMKIAYIPEAIVYHLVPESRTTLEFIREQALGNGLSEQIRSKANKTYTKCLFIESIKWCATFILWFRYALVFKIHKANMLIRFRYWISKGMIKTIKSEGEN